MRKRRMFLIAGIFAVFQGMMPLIGWVCVHTIVQYFTWFEALIPWIALILLGYIGVKMIHDSLTCCEECGECGLPAALSAILLQGVATSIDALSVGFTIAEYNLLAAVLAALLIAAVTFGICTAGIFIGRKAGTKLAGKAGIFGGSILIFIGLEIFITSFF
jgi:putative Mn2+ efflux pump MntP